VCFARIRFQRRRNKLPLFELDWQSFKTGLCQNMLPKVRIATSKLPKRFFLFLKKGKPHMHVKSVLAAAFI
jgi:hypothetical protein